MSDAPPAAPTLLLQIQSNALAPASLTAQQRRACIAHLIAEAFTRHEIAQILELDPRTVRRHMAKLRKDERLEPSLELGDELLGEYDRIASDSIARLTRLSRQPDTPPYAKLWAEEAIVRIYDRFLDAARRMNQIETSPGRINQLRSEHPDEVARMNKILAPLEPYLARTKR